MARPLRKSVDICDVTTGHLTQVYVHTGSTVIEDETYTYNVWGSRSERDDVLHNEVEHYSYDAEARVTGAQARLASGNTVSTLAATYDTSGNLLAKSDAGGSISYSYQGGHPNRLASLTVSGPSPGITGGSIGYDAAGRIVAGAGYSVAYDRRGRVSALQGNGTTLQLAYAPDGARYRAATENASGKGTLPFKTGTEHGQSWVMHEQYRYDIRGSRTERDDVLHNEVECFCVLRGKNNAFFRTIIQVPF